MIRVDRSQLRHLIYRSKGWKRWRHGRMSALFPKARTWENQRWRQEGWGRDEMEGSRKDWVTYLEEFALCRSEVSHVALVLLLHWLWEFATEFLFFSASSGELELTNFQPVEFGGLAPVAWRAEDEVLVETCSRAKGWLVVCDYVVLNTNINRNSHFTVLSCRVTKLEEQKFELWKAIGTMQIAWWAKLTACVRL